MPAPVHNARLSGTTTLLFDWDGTIVDSAQSSFLTFQKALAHVGVPFTWEQFEEHFTPDWHRMYEAVGLDASRFREADAAWRTNYPSVGYGPVDGAHETLSTLKTRGYRLGVVTSGSRWRLEPEIIEFRMNALFDVLVCNEDVRQRKPHPEGIHKAIAALSCPLERCAYVGDVPEDVLAGKNARVATVGIHGKYPTSRRLAEAAPDLHLRSFAELLDHFHHRNPV